MKLQSFLLSLLLLSMLWSQCFSASSCKMANWWGTFDHKGWSTCDSSTEYIKGLWRNDPSGDDEIYLLEEAKCCSAPTPFESTPSTCQTANWWGVLDGWVLAFQLLQIVIESKSRYKNDFQFKGLCHGSPVHFVKFCQILSLNHYGT